MHAQVHATQGSESDSCLIVAAQVWGHRTRRTNCSSWNCLQVPCFIYQSVCPRLVCYFCGSLLLKFGCRHPYDDLCNGGPGSRDARLGPGVFPEAEHKHLFWLYRCSCDRLLNAIQGLLIASTLCFYMCVHAVNNCAEIRRLVRHGLVWMAPPCSSWSFMPLASTMVF